MKSAYKRLAECGYWQASALLAAFAHILEAPFGSAQGEQEDKVNTVRGQVVEAACDGSWVAPTGAISALTRLADAIDSLRAEVKALKGDKP